MKSKQHSQTAKNIMESNEISPLKIDDHIDAIVGQSNSSISLDSDSPVNQNKRSSMKESQHKMAPVPKEMHLKLASSASVESEKPEIDNGRPSL